MLQKEYQSRILQLAEEIRLADAIVVGGGSGLSSAAGYNHYHWSPALLSELEIFYDTYGFKSPFEGFYYCYSSPEEQWGYYAAYIQMMWQAPAGKPYLDLKQLIGEKPYFILTTNVDMQTKKVFPEKQVCTFQGDFGFLQCSQPCHDHLYDNRAMTAEMCRKMEGTRIPSELLPRCQECGRIMVPWVRDDTFLEGTDWKKSLKQYHDFLREWLINKAGSRVLLLELGVGEMTLGVIKLSFWELTAQYETVHYVCINQKQSEAPMHIRDRSLYIADDIGKVLSDVIAIK